MCAEKCEASTMLEYATHLVVAEVTPEAHDSSLVGVVGHDGVLLPRLVDVLEDDDGLGEGAAGVEQHGDLLVDGVVEEERGALVGQVLLHVLELQPLELESELDAVGVGACPHPEELQLMRGGLGCGARHFLSQWKEAPEG